MIPLPGPGILAVSGAGLLQEPHPTTVASPLPGGIAAVVRFLFQVVPQWIQIGGLFVGAAVAAVVAVWLWRRRPAIVAWIRTRPRRWKIGMGAAVGVVVLGGAG